MLYVVSIRPVWIQYHGTRGSFESHTALLNSIHNRYRYEVTQNSDLSNPCRQQVFSDDSEEERLSSQHLLRVRKFVVASKLDHLLYFQCYDDTSASAQFVDIQDPDYERRELLSCCESILRAVGQMFHHNTTVVDFPTFCQQGLVSQSRLLQDMLDSTSMLLVTLLYGTRDI